MGSPYQTLPLSYPPSKQCLVMLGTNDPSLKVVLLTRVAGALCSIVNVHFWYINKPCTSLHPHHMLYLGHHRCCCCYCCLLMMCLNTARFAQYTRSVFHDSVQSANCFKSWLYNIYCTWLLLACCQQMRL